MTLRPGIIFFRFCFVIPMAILTIAYVMISLVNGSFFLWWVPVHEDGERTFFMTVFYFEHGARELPLDLLLGVIVGGAASLGLQPARPIHSIGAWGFLGAIVTVIIGGTLATVGFDGLVENITQSHTRPGVKLQLGSHWYYHFLSRLTLFLAAIAIGFLLRSCFGQKSSHGKKAILMGIALYGIISVIFMINPALFITAFTDTVFLGHQARELLTHALVTVPLAFWACYIVAHKPAPSAIDRRVLSVGIALGGITILCALYIGMNALSGGAMDQGQSTDIRVLIFPHFFEHSFSYLITSVTAVAVFRSCGSSTPQSI